MGYLIGINKYDFRIKRKDNKTQHLTCIDKNALNNINKERSIILQLLKDNGIIFQDNDVISYTSNIYIFKVNEMPTEKVINDYINSYHNTTYIVGRFVFFEGTYQNWTERRIFDKNFENDETFGERLRYFRNRSKLSQRQVAELLGIKPSTYNKYEIGKAEPSLKTIIKLVDIFSVDYEALLSNIKL